MGSFDFNRYVWRKDDKIAGRLLREAGGGEYIEDFFNKKLAGEQNLFLGIYATVGRAIAVDILLDNIRLAWASLRWDVPTIAAMTAHDSQNEKICYLVYDLANSAREVEEWAKTTVQLKEGYTNLDTLRYDIGDGPLPKDDNLLQTFLYVVPTSLTTFGLLLHTSHLPFDGTGVKTLMSFLLRHLSHYIDDVSYAEKRSALQAWGREDANLLPAITEVLRTEHEPAIYDASGALVQPKLPPEEREGAAYDETLGNILARLKEEFPRAYPFKNIVQPIFDVEKDSPKTRRTYRTFSAEETEKIMTADHKGAEGKLSINHLVHGALNVLTVIDNPPEPGSDGVVFYYGLFDGRVRFQKKYRERHGYPGYCLGMSTFGFAVSEFSPIQPGEEKMAVLTAARMVQKEYKLQAEMPSLVAVNHQQVELMVGASSPPPWCGPWFAGDGRGSLHLDEYYPNSEQKVIQIDDFFVGLNKTEPGPFFRVTEWKGRLMLSADYNEKAVTPKVAEGWMKKWADLVSLLAE